MHYYQLMVIIQSLVIMVFLFRDLIGGPLLTGIHHNNKGYMNHQYDEFTDFKTMLTRLSYSVISLV